MNVCQHLSRRLSVLSNQVSAAQPKRRVATLAMSQARGDASGPKSVAVVGAGISGSVCALSLVKMGHNVTVFDMGKARPGGRMSTRKVNLNSPSDKQQPHVAPLMFDHGAQLFTATTPEFQQLVEEWVSQGVACAWEGAQVCEVDVPSGSLRGPGDAPLPKDAAAASSPGLFDSLLSPPSGQPRKLYVGSPSQDAPASLLVKAAAQQQPGAGTGRLQLHLGTRVAGAAWEGGSPHPQEGRWALQLQLGGSAGAQEGASNASPAPAPVFDALVVADTMPGRAGSPGHLALQSARPPAHALLQRLASVPRAPLFSLMLAVQQGEGGEGLLPQPWQAARLARPLGGFQWLACDSAKPGRGRSDGVQCWVAITTEDFARSLVEQDGSGPLPPQGPAYLAAKAQQLWQALQKDLEGLRGGRPLPQPLHLACHRWGSAYPTAPLPQRCLAEPGDRLAACGDYCGGGGVEGAALSGLAAARAVQDMLGA